MVLSYSHVSYDSDSECTGRVAPTAQIACGTGGHVAIRLLAQRYAAIGEIDQERGRAALADLADFPVHRYPHDFLLPRIWELRNNLTAYDAVYVALAEALEAPLLTRGRRLAAAMGHRATIELV